MSFITEPFRSYKRIISVVPSQTELLAAFDADEVIGITKFCIHPPSWRTSKVIVGGTKNLKIDLIRSLQPDLIIANKEENEKRQIELLSKDFDCYVSDINDLNSALAMINDVGILCNKTEAANELINKIKSEFEALQKPDIFKRGIYLIWKDPYMSAGNDTFIHKMLEYCGIQNCITASRYPEIELNDMIKLMPDLILLSSEPYPFREKHIKELQDCLEKTSILLVDGEYFSWYGSRLLSAPGYFNQLIQQIHNR